MKSGNGMAGTGTSPWRCWPTPAWRWSGARRWNKEVREKRGLSQLGRKTDTPDGARGPAVALPADMETSTYGRISAAVVPVETAAPGNGPALPLPTPPETPHHISATVVLKVIRGAMESSRQSSRSPEMHIPPWYWFRKPKSRHSIFVEAARSRPTRRHLYPYYCSGRHHNRRFRRTNNGNYSGLIEWDKDRHPTLGGKAESDKASRY